MPANNNPIFPIAPKVQWATLAAANSAKDGTGTVATVFTAGANGSRIDQIKIRALGTNVATVVRFFINNGSATTTAANNTLVHEVTIAATTISENSAQVDNDVTIPKGSDVAVPIPYLPAGYKILATTATAVAAGLHVTVFGGDY